MRTIADNIVEKLVLEGGTITSDIIETSKETAVRTKKSLQQVLLDSDVITDNDLTKLFSKYTAIPYADLNPSDIPYEVLTKIPERIAKQYNAILFKIDPDGLLHLAMEDPDDVQAVDFIEKEIGENTKLYIATHANILACLGN